MLRVFDCSSKIRNDVARILSSQPVSAMECYTGTIFNATSLQIVSLKIVQCRCDSTSTHPLQRVEAEWKNDFRFGGKYTASSITVSKSLLFWILSRLFPSIFYQWTYEDERRKNETSGKVQVSKFIKSSLIFTSKCCAICQPFQDAFIHNSSTLKCQCGPVVFLFLVNLKCSLLASLGLL